MVTRCHIERLSAIITLMMVFCAPATDGSPTSGLKTLEHDNLSNTVYATLCDALIKGQFQPGDRLKIREIAEKLGTSVTPVRDAILRLASPHLASDGPCHFRFVQRWRAIDGRTSLSRDRSFEEARQPSRRRRNPDGYRNWG